MRERSRFLIIPPLPIARVSALRRIGGILRIMKWGLIASAMILWVSAGCSESRVTDASLVQDAAATVQMSGLPPIPPETTVTSACANACEHLQACGADYGLGDCISACSSSFDTEVLGCEEITLQALVCIPQTQCPDESGPTEPDETPCQDALNLAFVHCMSAGTPDRPNGSPFG